MRWPKGPPHLALNPPFFVFSLLSFFVFNRKSLFFPHKKGISVCPCLPLFLFCLFFGPPPFSLSLALSV